MDQDKTRISIDAQRPSVGPSDACIVQIYGGELGKRYPLTREFTVGRDVSNSIVLDLDNVSRRHARFFEVAGTYYVADLGSTNGTQVNDTDVRSMAALANGDLVKVGGVIFKFISGGNVEALYHEEIYRMTIIDGLTQIHNKRYFMDFLDREMARSLRCDRALSLILFDIDHFKVLNDTYGHLAGDFVLRKMSELIGRHVRREELFARYGGEEFALVLPETELASARVFGEKIRALVDAAVFDFDGEEIRATISVGIVALHGPSEPLEFIKAADTLLYQAKSEGRNRVVAG
ncbi:MAG: GGDEF domain-containing protein [bacterium]|nr:GGDEF domain-containing protein [bacterium]